jgi:hypothetical protein
MKTGNFDAILYRLHRKPVLTAMMVCSLVLGMSAVIADIRVGRVSAECATARTSAPSNVEQDIASGSDQLMHQALQAELVREIGQTPHRDSPLSHKDASGSCPCAVSSEWHWQRI